MVLIRSIAVTAQGLVEAISLSLGVKMEIVDENLSVVAGTGALGPGGHRGLASSMYRQVIDSGEPRVLSTLGLGPLPGDGCPGDFDNVEAVCYPVFHDGRAIGAMLAVFCLSHTVVTDRKHLLGFLEKVTFLLGTKVTESKALDRLTSLSKHLSTVIETIHEGVIAIGGDGIVTHCNSRAESLVGMSRERLVGEHLSLLWEGSPMLEVLRTGIPYIEREEVYHSGQGRRHLIVTAKPIRADGKVTGVVASFKSLAEVRNLVYNISGRAEQSSFEDIKGESESMDSLKKQALRISRGNSTVLITGESGTGKELFARAIHHASSRSSGPLITVNCGAIPESLLESELFGYDGGAFTGAKKEGKPGKFELADGGTIFLDEIGDLPLHLQAKLLHVLQLRTVDRVGGTQSVPVDVRVIAATNRDLETMIRDGEFRSDLYFRLNVIPLFIPPLGERREDIPVLLGHFLSKHTTLLGKRISGFDAEAMDIIVNYEWPGNVRELENAVEYAVNMEMGRVISTKRLPPRILKVAPKASGGAISLRFRIQRHEREILEECLNQCGWDREGKEKVARILKISRATLYRKLAELDLDAPSIK